LRSSILNLGLATLNLKLLKDSVVDYPCDEA